MGADPFIGEIQAFGFPFAPRGWAACNGQLLSIMSNTALFSLIGTTYGGDGEQTFQLPDLGARFPMHQQPEGEKKGRSERLLGDVGGGEDVVLSPNQMPEHKHAVHADNTDGRGKGASVRLPNNSVLSVPQETPIYSDRSPNVEMDPSVVGTSGSGAAHNNVPPFQVVNYCIALQGVFPSRK